MMLSKLPLVFIGIGLILLLLSFVTITTSARKVKVAKHKAPINNSKKNFLYIWMGKIINANEFLSKTKNKLAFNLGYVSSKNERKNNELAEYYLSNYILFMIIEFIAIMMYVPNLGSFFKFLICLSAYFFQHLFYINYISIKRSKLINNFPLMLSAYIPAYIECENVKESFDKSINEMPVIFHVHVRRIINELSSGQPLNKALNGFQKRMNYTLCSCFVTIIKGTNISSKETGESLVNLEVLIASDRANDKKHKESLKDRKSNIIFLIIVIIVEIIATGSYAATYTGNYFLTTVDGQMLLLGTVAGIIVSIIFLIMAERT